MRDEADYCNAHAAFPTQHVTELLWQCMCGGSGDDFRVRPSERLLAGAYLHVVGSLFRRTLIPVVIWRLKVLRLILGALVALCSLYSFAVQSHGLPDHRPFPTSRYMSDTSAPARAAFRLTTHRKSTSCWTQ